MNNAEHKERITALTEEENRLREEGADLTDFYRRKNEYALEFMKDFLSGNFDGDENAHCRVDYEEHDNFYYDKIKVVFSDETPTFTILPAVIADMEKEMPENNRVLYDFMSNKVDMTYYDFEEEYDEDNPVNPADITPLTTETDENGETWVTYDEDTMVGDSKPFNEGQKYLLKDGMLWESEEDYANDYFVNYTDDYSHWNSYNYDNPFTPLMESKKALKDILKNGEIASSDIISEAAAHYQKVLPDNHPFKITDSILKIRCQQVLSDPSILQQLAEKRDTIEEISSWDHIFPHIDIRKNEDNTFTVTSPFNDNKITVDGEEIDKALESYIDARISKTVQKINKTLESDSMSLKDRVKAVLYNRIISSRTWDSNHEEFVDVYCKVDGQKIMKATENVKWVSDVDTWERSMAETINKYPLAAAINLASGTQFDEKAAQRIYEALYSGKDPELTELAEELKIYTRCGELQNAYNSVLEEQGSPVYNSVDIRPADVRSIDIVCNTFGITEKEALSMGTVKVNVIARKAQEIPNYLEKYEASEQYPDLADKEGFKHAGSISHQIEYIVDHGVSPDNVRAMEDLRLGYQPTGYTPYIKPCDKALELIANAPDREAIEMLYNPSPDMTADQNVYLREIFCKTGDTELVNYLVEHGKEWENIDRKFVNYWKGDGCLEWFDKPDKLIEQYQQAHAEHSDVVENNGLSEFDSVAPEQDGGAPASNYEPGSLEFEEEVEKAIIEVMEDTRNNPAKGLEDPENEKGQEK